MSNGEGKKRKKRKKKKERKKIEREIGRRLNYAPREWIGVYYRSSLPVEMVVSSDETSDNPSS
jgi:hypothetical protein